MKKIIKKTIIDPGSPPDVDTDFQTNSRAAVIDYVSKKYNSDNVASIITPGPFKNKNAWKSMATIHSIPFQEANKISQLIPDGSDGTKIRDLIDVDSEKYKEGIDLRLATSEPLLNETLKYADEISGRMRETGVHPCGIVISSLPLDESIPLQIRQNDELTVTQWDYYDCEALGLIKMDFLGLDTVDIIENAVKFIEKSKGIKLNMEDIIEGDLNDEKVFELFQKGDTSSIFQFSGAGVKELLKAVKPTEFEDLAAITALYRPGPMGLNLHNDYADRKNNPSARIPVHKDFIGTKVEEILSPTLAALVYQEQVMQISQQCAGFTPKEADGLRKAIGKKKMDLMKSIGNSFKEGMIKNGYTEESVNVLWDGIVAFGQYAFNKSHSISYALNSYQLAYLKVHYPTEFMAAVLKQRMGSDDISTLFSETRAMGIKIETPNINYSREGITPNENSISYGLSSIKGINKELIHKIIQERDENGKYKDIKDFISRNKSQIKSATLKSLAYAGAFDILGVTRKDIADKANELISKFIKVEKMNETASLFGLLGMSNDDLVDIKLSGEEWPFEELIKNEALATGIYLSANPLDNILDNNGTVIADTQPGLDHVSPGDTIYVTFTNISTKKNKQGKTTYIVTMDNKVSQKEIFLSQAFTNRFNLHKALKNTNGDKLKAYELLGLSMTDTPELEPLEELELYTPYKIIYGGYKKPNGEMFTFIKDIQKVKLSNSGELLKYFYINSNDHNDFVRICNAIENSIDNKMAIQNKKKTSDIRIYNKDKSLYRDLSVVSIGGMLYDNPEIIAEEEN